MTTAPTTLAGAPPHTALRLLPDARRDRPISLAEHRAVYPHPPAITGVADHALIEEFEHSGLRGRGGAGFPTATKMRAVVSNGSTPVVVINGCEGEPASFKDKTLMTHNPHLVLDGAMAAASAVGAIEIIIGVETASALAIASLEVALAERVRVDEWCPVDVVELPARFVSGESSALVAYLNAKDALPTLTPPRTAERGVDGRPTLVDNVETAAHLAQITRWGASWFRECGTDSEPGTTLLTISGAVASPGVYEVSIGTPMADAVRSAGGKLVNNSAALVGGYFGTWLTGAQVKAALVSSTSMAEHGAGIGCGAIVVLPRQACGLKETARVLRWMAGESAGQCGMCVNGLAAIAQLTNELSLGQADPGAVATLTRWAGQIDGRGACSLPDGAVQFLRSALAVFATDIAAHQDGKCCVAACAPSILPLPSSLGGS